MSDEVKQEMPAHARQGLETVVALHERAQLGVGRHHRIIERATAEIGKPRSLYLVVSAVLGWIAWNSLARGAGLPCPDPPPFVGLECAASVLALLLTMTVLTTQNRQGRISEARSHLELQVSLLSEQRMAKLISLVEELRVDLPNVRNRSDPVADDMKAPVDANKLAEALEQTLVDEEQRKE
jgi:uncharacterized membrane protein